MALAIANRIRYIAMIRSEVEKISSRTRRGRVAQRSRTLCGEHHRPEIGGRSRKTLCHSILRARTNQTRQVAGRRLVGVKHPGDQRVCGEVEATG